MVTHKGDVVAIVIVVFLVVRKTITVNTAELIREFQHLIGMFFKEGHKFLEFRLCGKVGAVRARAFNRIAYEQRSVVAIEPAPGIRENRPRCQGAILVTHFIFAVIALQIRPVDTRGNLDILFHP